MPLSQRFSDVSCDVHISTRKVDQSYPIVKAERVKTRYGETVLLSIRAPQNLSVRDMTPALLRCSYPNDMRQSSQMQIFRQLTTNKFIGIWFLKAYVKGQLHMCYQLNRCFRFSDDESQRKNRKRQCLAHDWKKISEIPIWIWLKNFGSWIVLYSQLT